MPLVMSTVRTARRWIRTDRLPLGIDGRELVIVTCLCVAVFACFFAIGRVASPGSGPREEASPTLPVAVGGTAIPVRLSSAPPLDVGVAARTSRPARRGNVRIGVENIAATAQGPTNKTPPLQVPRTEASPSTSPPTQTSAPPAPTSSHERASRGAESPPANREPSRSAPSTGKSFDSSG